MLSQCLFAKRIEKKNSRNSDDSLPINCLNSVFSRFLLLSSSFNSKLSVNPSWLKWCIFKTSQKSHSLERAQEVKIFPQWSGEGQKSVMSMSSDIYKFCTCATGCQKFSNGCFQSPSFPDHVTKKRRALGTRMLLIQRLGHAYYVPCLDILLPVASFSRRVLDLKVPTIYRRDHFRKFKAWQFEK